MAPFPSFLFAFATNRIQALQSSEIESIGRGVSVEGETEIEVEGKIGVMVEMLVRLLGYRLAESHDELPCLLYKILKGIWVLSVGFPTLFLFLS